MTQFRAVIDLLNANQGALTLVLFVTTVLLGWTSGIFSALRRRPKFRIRVGDGPTFVCTLGTGKTHGQFQVHRTCIALYLYVSNVGSASASIANVAIGYHWAIKPFRKHWLRYGLGWFWLKDQALALIDFHVAVGEDYKGYPFLVQRSFISGASPKTFLETGAATNGVVYFEQEDSFGYCFRRARNRIVKIKVRITDTFGRTHTQKLTIPRYTLAKARAYNPKFGLTKSTIQGDTSPVEFPTDSHGNLIPTQAEMAGPSP